MGDTKLTRRAFLASATLAAGAASLKWSWAQTVNTARVVPRKISPNEKLNVAGIGVGGMGSGDIQSVGKFKDLVNIVAMCDVDTSEKQTGEARAAFPDAKFYTDYR
ncbi:MAG TPA: gfo/Idh/MocA family oxidoreductase, partial [Candidatus Hydrogenedentes bacterium]|nr:gfo/Idh/MocA family oxidoreductase [Candidatus Hydrogenedentota bacterium]